MQRIFISYSRADAEFANELASSLTKRGLYVWIEDEAARKNKKPGVDFGETLDPYDVMLVIVSPDSMASPLIEAEWRYFRKQRKPVIPLLWRPASLPVTLHNFGYVDFYRQNYDDALKHLHRRLAYRIVSGRIPSFFGDYAGMNRISMYIKAHMAWLPFFVVTTGMALYLVACLPPGGRFIYPLGRWFGTAVTGDTLIGSRGVWIVFLFTCAILTLLPLFLRDYVVKPCTVIVGVIVLMGCCYLPFFCALSVGLYTSRWSEIDTIQTPDHRFYLVERSFDSGSTGTLLMMCDHDGFLCELMIDDFLRDSRDYYITSWRDQLTLEVVGDTINVRDGSAVVFTIPIP